MTLALRPWRLRAALVASRALLALAALALGGCATFDPREGVMSVLPSTRANAPLPPGAVRVTVEAPPELQVLLDRHLDLARLSTMAGDDSVSDTEWQRLIDTTPTQVRDILQTEGFFAPDVRVIREPGEPPTIRVKVDPGPRSVISRVTFEVEGELQRKADAGDAGARDLLASLRGAWPLAPGTPFRNAVWSDAKASYVARMRSAGYASAIWIGTGAEVDPERGEVRLFLAADSGPLFRFGELVVEGLVTHDAQTVRNIADFEPGMPLTDAKLLDFQERMQKANLFDSVSVGLEPEPERAEAARVVVRVREQSLENYTFGIGISANTGPRVSLEHTHRRPFGLAAITRNTFEWGRDKQSWDGQIASHPGERLYRNLLGAVVERLESSSDVVLSQRVRLGRTKEGPRIERLAYLEAERSSRTTDTGLDNSDSLAVSANYHGLWRRLDSILLPTEGYSLSTQTGLGYARDAGVGSAPYGRLYGRYTHYFSLGNAWFLQARAEAGQVFLRSDIEIPDSQRFRAGGESSVRGYDYRSLGPVKDGVVGSGNMLFTSSVELARPVSAKLPTVWGAVFVDAGNAANSWGALDPVLGVGVGVRWRSPVGPLQVDYAWGEALREFRLHFSVGITF